MENQSYSNQLNALLAAIDRSAETTTANKQKFDAMYSDSRKKWDDTMNRLLDREEQLGSGNPFTDMLNSYIKMRKRNDPNYQWEGLLGSLFKKPDNSQYAQPFIGPRPER